MKKLVVLSFFLILGVWVSAQDEPLIEKKAQKVYRPKVFVAGGAERSASQVQKIFEGAKPESTETQVQATPASGPGTDPYDEEETAADKLREDILRSERDNRLLKLELDRQHQERAFLGTALAKAQVNVQRKKDADYQAIGERDALKERLSGYQTYLDEQKSKRTGLRAGIAIASILSMASPFVAMGLNLSGVLSATAAVGLGLGGTLFFVFLAIMIGVTARASDEDIELQERLVERTKERVQHIEQDLGLKFPKPDEQ